MKKNHSQDPQPHVPWFSMRQGNESVLDSSISSTKKKQEDMNEDETCAICLEYEAFEAQMICLLKGTLMRLVRHKVLGAQKTKRLAQRDALHCLWAIYGEF